MVFTQVGGVIFEVAPVLPDPTQESIRSGGARSPFFREILARDRALFFSCRDPDHAKSGAVAQVLGDF